jgi:prevent-host-death family protein
MKEVSISELRTHCYAIVREVQRTGKPVLITRFGKPLAEIRPCSPAV